MKNCRVIPREARLTQLRLLWAEVVIKGREKRIWNRGEKKIKTWKLKDLIKRRIFEERVTDRTEEANHCCSCWFFKSIIEFQKGILWRNNSEET